MLPHNISQGVIISNHSLVLQGVSRATAGNYSCVGFNAEGDGISPPFTLNVLCKSSILYIYSQQATQNPVVSFFCCCWFVSVCCCVYFVHFVVFGVCKSYAHHSNTFSTKPIRIHLCEFRADASRWIIHQSTGSESVLKLLRANQINVQYLHKRNESVTKWKILLCNNLYIALLAIFCAIFSFSPFIRQEWTSHIFTWFSLFLAHSRQRRNTMSWTVVRNQPKHAHNHITKVSDQVEQQQ